MTADLQAPLEVKQILKNSCYSCHSNETALEWFDKVAPVYWLVASDVKEARMHLNFSEPGAQPAAKQKAVLFEAVNQIQLGALPLPSYRCVHPRAVVTAGRVQGSIDGIPVPFVGLEDLILNKESTGRPKDLGDADALRRRRPEG